MNGKEERRLHPLANIIFLLTLAAAILLTAFLISRGFYKEHRPLKTGSQIYEEADYLAKIYIVQEDPKTGQTLRTQASGFLTKLGDRYLIFTVAHLEIEGFGKTKEITVTFKEQSGTYFASVEKKNTKLDCLVLKIDDPKFSFLGRLSALNLKDDLKVGNRVYSIGSPFEIDYCLGEGIIRSLGHESGQIITNAETGLAPGSSGGPLLNAYGEIIGINVAMHVEDAWEGRFFYPSFYYSTRLTDILAWLDSQYKTP